jgi:hypothetical protein
LKFIIVLEDTHRGVRAVCATQGNDITDNIYESLSGKVLANWTGQLKILEELGVLVMDTPPVTNDQPSQQP